MTGGFHAKDTRRIANVFENEVHKRVSTLVCSCKAKGMPDLFALGRNNGSFVMIFTDINSDDV